MAIFTLDSHQSLCTRVDATSVFTVSETRERERERVSVNELSRSRAIPVVTRVTARSRADDGARSDLNLSSIHLEIETRAWRFESTCKIRVAQSVSGHV